MDLGAYTQSAWLFSNFQTPVNTVLDIRHAWGNHFDFLLPVVGIFYKVFPSPVFLLFLQSAFVGSMAIPLTKLYTRFVGQKDLIYHLLVLTLFINLPVFNTILYDFRTYILGASLSLWILYFWEVRRLTPFYILFFIMLLSKESVGPWGVFLGIYFLTRKDYRVAAITIFASIVQFYIAQKLVIPAFWGGESFHLQYQELGNTFSEIIVTLITQPLTPISILIRTQFLLYYLVTLARFPLLLLYPTGLILIIPNILERFLSTKETMWTDNFHYSFILAPLLIYISVIGLSRIENIKKWKGYIVTALLISLIFNVSQVTMSEDSRINDINWKVQKNVVDYLAISEELKVIPTDAPVSAQDNYVPHLSNREQIYKLTLYEEADYIVLNRTKGYWPLSSEEYNTLYNSINDTGKYEIIKINEKYGLEIYRKIDL